MNNPTLFYVYDPLCGWCYGFHPVMEKIAGRFEGKLEIEVIPGGLAAGENAEPIGEGYGYIKDAIGQVEDATGIEFGNPFRKIAEEGTMIYDSEPPSRMQNVMNRLAPDLALSFAGALQNALFSDGKNLNNWSTFSQLLESYPVSKSQAEALYTSDELKKETLDRFKWSKDQGATAFPTLLLKIGDQTGIMSRGYRPYDTLESHLHHLLRNIEAMSG